MGNIECCCTDNSKDSNRQPSYMDVHEGALMPRQSSNRLRQSKILNRESSLKDEEKFFKKHEIKGLIYSSRSGLYENYLCLGYSNSREGGPVRDIKRKMLQTIKLEKSCLQIAQEKLTTLMSLDDQIVEPLLDSFYDNGNLYLVNRYID